MLHTCNANRKESENGPCTTSYEMLESMLNEAKAMGQKRTAYAERLSTDIIGRIDVIIRDSQVISKKVRSRTRQRADSNNTSEN